MYEVHGIWIEASFANAVVPKIAIMLIGQQCFSQVAICLPLYVHRQICPVRFVDLHKLGYGPVVGPLVWEMRCYGNTILRK